MISKLLGRLSGSIEKKRLASNLFSLGILQGINYLLSLLTVPYLVRILGPEKFGMLAFVFAVISYFMLISEYGFNTSATRLISINKDNHSEISKIYSGVMQIKIVLALICFLILCLIIFLAPGQRQLWLIYLLTFGMVIGQLIFPIWLFLGMEQMGLMTAINIIPRIIATILIFTLVRQETDFWLVPLLNSVGCIFAGLLSIFLVSYRYKIRFKCQSLIVTKLMFLDGWHVFFSNLASSIYTITNTVILGIFVGHQQLGYFSAVDKIIQAAKGFFIPISQAIYPMLAKRIHLNRHQGLLFVRKYTGAVALITFTGSFAIFIFADQIVDILLGSKFTESVILLRLMAFIPFLGALTNVLGVQTMLSLGHKKAFVLILVTAALSSLILNLIFIPHFAAKAASLVALFTEFFILVQMVVYIFKKEFKKPL